MNVFPSAIRDLVVARFATRVDPVLRVVKDHQDQVRFDGAIPLEVEATQKLDTPERDALAHEIEAEVRSQLQVRVAVAVLPPGTLPRGTYKNALVVVRDNPYFSQPSSDGSFGIAPVPPGRYTLHAWHERSSETTRDLMIPAEGMESLKLELDARGYKFKPHLNKFGRPYPQQGRRY